MRMMILPCVLIALSACGERPADPAAADAAATGAAASPAVDPLVGVWRTEAPAEFQGEALRTRVTDGLTAYDRHNRFAYQGRLTIFGPRLPDGGLQFAMAGTGSWRRDGDRLIEDYDRVTVTPDHEDGELRRLSNALATELAEAEPSVSRIVTVEPERLTLRTEDGRDARYARAR